MASELAVWPESAPPEEGANRPPGLSISCTSPATRSASARSSGRCSNCSVSSRWSISSGCGKARSDPTRTGRTPPTHSQRIRHRHRRLAGGRRSPAGRSAIRRAPDRGSRLSPPRDRVLAARGGDLYRFSAQGSLSRQNLQNRAPRRRWSLTFICPIEHGPRAGIPSSRLHLSGASLSSPGPQDRNTEARQCHGQDHLYSERRD